MSSYLPSIFYDKGVEGVVEKWAKLMVEKADTKIIGLQESLDGLKKLVVKMKLESDRKEVGLDKEMERLIKNVNGMKEKSNKKEKVTPILLQKKTSPFFLFSQPGS